MDSKQGKSGTQAIDELQSLLKELSTPRLGKDGAAFRHLRALHEKTPSSRTRQSPIHQAGAPSPAESSTLAALRQASEEANARVAQAEKAKARAEAALREIHKPDKKELNRIEKQVKATIAAAGASRSDDGSPSSPAKKPKKSNSFFNNIILGLNYTPQTRAWTAPREEDMVLREARQAIGEYRFNDSRRSRMLHDLVREIKAKGGNELDAVKILQDFVDKRISSDEATARLRGLDVDKKDKDKAKELSLTEQEEIVQLELREKQLMLQKLQLAKREEARKEVEEMRKKIKQMGLPILLQDAAYADPYQRGHYYGNNAAAAAYGGKHAQDDDVMFLDGGSIPFDIDELGELDVDKGALGRAKTMDGRSNRLNQQRMLPQFNDDIGDEMFDDEAMLEEPEVYEAERLRRSLPSVPGAGGRGSQRAMAGHPMFAGGVIPGETVGKSGVLPRFDMSGASAAAAARARTQPRRASTTGAAVNFRIAPNDPRLDPRSAYYKLEWVRRYKEQQLREAQIAQMAQQAEAEKGRKLELEKLALRERRDNEIRQAQLYQQKIENEEKRALEAKSARGRAEIMKDLETVRTLEEIAAQEEQLQRLENLIRLNPRAKIPGLDMNKAKKNPVLLQHALQLMQDNIRNPSATSSSGKRLKEAMRKEHEELTRRERLVEQEEQLEDVQSTLEQQEAELNRLEHLLTLHPNAGIKGLNIGRISSEPALLRQALRQVEQNIERGETPIHIVASTQHEPLHEARTHMLLSDTDRELLEGFLNTSYEVQDNYLRRLASAEQRAQVLDMAMQEASLEQAQQLIERFRPHGFDLQMPAVGPQQRNVHRVAPVIPTIVINNVRSPPPTQDTTPAESSAGNGWGEPTVGRAASSSNKSSKGKGRAMDVSLPPNTVSSILSEMPTPPQLTPGRTSATHPMGAAAAELQARQAAEELEAEEAALAQERREIEEAEAALVRAEEERIAAETKGHQDEAVLAVVAAQENARAQAAADMEAVAQSQAAEMADSNAGWSEPMLEPENSPLLEEDLLPDDLGQEEQDNDAWGQATAEVNDGWGGASSQNKNEGASPAKSQPNDAWGSPQSKKNDAWGSPVSNKVSPSPKVKSTTVAAASVRSDGNVFSPAFAAASVHTSGKAPSQVADWSPYQSPAKELNSRIPSAAPSQASSRAASLRSAATPVFEAIKSPAPPPLAAASLRSASIRSEKAASPMLSGTRTPLATQLAASPIASYRSATPASIIAQTPVLSAHSTPKAATPASERHDTPNTSRQPSPLAARTPTPVLARTPTPVLASTPTPILTKTPTPVLARSPTPLLANTPTPILAKTPTPFLARSPTPLASPARFTTPKAPSVIYDSPKQATPRATTPDIIAGSMRSSPARSTTAAVADAWGSAPAPNADAWGSASTSPSPAKSSVKATAGGWGSPVIQPSPAKSSTKATGAWDSPVVQASPAKTQSRAASVHASSAARSSPAKSPEKTTGGWGSPVVQASSAKSSVKGVGDAWGTRSPAKTATPAQAPPIAGGWGTPVLSPEKVFSPAKSVASKAASAKSKVMSPVFGMDTMTAQSLHGSNASEAENGPSTAIKGSDPVVVSCIAPTPIAVAGTGEPVAYPGEDYSDNGEEQEEEEEEEEEGEPFDPSEFPIYMVGEQIEPGMNMVMDPPPHPFQEAYPKSAPNVTLENVLNYFATIAHNAGFDAIFQCRAQEAEEAILVQGYMVRLEPASTPPPGVGGPFDIPDKQGGSNNKATFVSDASTPGHG